MGLEGDERATLRRIADYQFGAGAGAALFPDGESVRLHRTGSGRISQVIADEGRLVSYGVDGRFTLGVAGGKRLRAADWTGGGAEVAASREGEPAVGAHEVAVGAESGPYLREGRNAFAKFVTAVDRGLRPGDEACVVGPAGGSGDDGTRPLLAVGRAELPGDAMLAFGTGVAVQVRAGASNGESG